MERFRTWCRPQWRGVISSRGPKSGQQPWQILHRTCKRRIKGNHQECAKKSKEQDGRRFSKDETMIPGTEKLKSNSVDGQWNTVKNVSITCLRSTFPAPRHQVNAGDTSITWKYFAALNKQILDLDESDQIGNKRFSLAGWMCRRT